MKAKRVWGLVLAAAMCMAVAGCGQEEAETANTEPHYQVIGPEAEGAYDIQLKNSITHSKSPKDIELLLEQLQIADKTHVPVGKLSYGQQQRVAFIRSLCQPFDFLLLDEPISHLDETNAHIMADILTSEARQRNAGVIITSVGKPLPLDYKQILKL